MNLDLILENIRLKHIETLLQEATSDIEVVRGQRLINESIIQLRGALLQEVSRTQPSNSNSNDSQAILKLGSAGLGAAIGGLYGHEVGAALDKMAEDNNEDYLKSLNTNVDQIENDPNRKADMISQFGTDYMNGLVPYYDEIRTPVATSVGASAGGLAGATLGGLSARRSMRR